MSDTEAKEIIERLRARMTTTEIAARCFTSERSIIRWHRGEAKPSRVFRELLKALDSEKRDS